MSKQEPKYIPALSFRALTPFYDPLLNWVMREKYFKGRLIEQADIRAGQHVLDVGCGTGTLALMMKQTQPQIIVVGLDGDPDILAIARRKAEQAGIDILFDQGLATVLPYEDHSFDRVLSSLVFHHLTAEDKQLALKEIYRVLKRGGEVHFADFGKPYDAYSRIVGYFMRHMERVDDNVMGLIPEYFRRAGFKEPKETASYTTFFGALTMIQARKE